jgi:hypothetical protein
MADRDRDFLAEPGRTGSKAVANQQVFTSTFFPATISRIMNRGTHSFLSRSWKDSPGMPFRRSALRYFCFLAVVGYALFLQAGFLINAFEGFSFDLVGRDRVSLTEKKYEEIKKHLPRYGNVGYFNDLNVQGKKVMMQKTSRGEPLDDETNRLFKRYQDRYYIELLHVQYALVPLKVILTPDCRFMIGDLSNPDDPVIKGYLRSEGYAIDKVLENGLILIKKVLE